MNIGDSMKGGTGKNSEGGWLGSGPLSLFAKVLIVLSIVMLVFCIVSVSSAHAAPLNTKPHNANVDKITFACLNDITCDTDVGKKITKQLAKDFLQVEKGYSKYTTAQMVVKDGRLTLYITDNIKHDGRWLAINSKLLERFGIDVDTVNVKLDNKQPAATVKRLKADGKWLFFYIDHFSTREVTFESGWMEYAPVFSEDAGNITVIDKRSDGAVLWFDFSPNGIVYTSGHYIVVDLSGNGNNGTIYGLTDNVLGNSTAIDGNSSHTVDFQYYNNITSASLIVNYNNTCASDVNVTVSLNQRQLGSFVATAGTASTYTFVGVESYITVNATNTVSYSSNNTITIEATSFNYDHDLTLVQQADGTWALGFDGINDYINVGDSSSLDITGTLTVSAWFKKSSTWSDNYRNLVGKQNYAPSYGMTIEWYSGNPIVWNINSGGTRYGVAGPTTPDEWVHAVGTYTSSTGDMYLYINGAQAGHTNIGAGKTIDVSTNPVRISETNRQFSGFIGAIRIYNTSQPQAQVKLGNALLQSGYRNPATLDEQVTPTIASTTFDGSNYLVTVNVSLPADGYGHLVYVPASAHDSYTTVATSADSNGNKFDIVDVGTAGYATFTLTIPSTLLPPDGINSLVFTYNDEIYVSGDWATLSVTNYTVTNVPKPTGVWYSSACEVTNYINNSLPSAKLYFNTNTTTTIAQSTAIVAQPTTWVNITPIRYDPQGTTSHVFKADAPSGEKVTFTLNGLRTSSVYTVYVDGSPTYVLDVGHDGSASFSHSSWSEHTFEVVLSGDTMSLTVKRLPGLFMLGCLVLVILSVLGMAVVAAPRIEGSELNKLILLILVAAMVIGAVALLVFAGYGVDLVRFITP